MKKEAIASRDFYDTWLPELAPSAPVVELGLAARSPQDWRRFERAYRREMNAPAARHLIGVLATLSKRTELSVGCYCEDEQRCHRSILRALLTEAGASVRA